MHVPPLRLSGLWTHVSHVIRQREATQTTRGGSGQHTCMQAARHHALPRPTTPRNKALPLPTYASSSSTTTACHMRAWPLAALLPPARYGFCFAALHENRPSGGMLDSAASASPSPPPVTLTCLRTAVFTPGPPPDDDATLGLGDGSAPFPVRPAGPLGGVPITAPDVAMGGGRPGGAPGLLLPLPPPPAMPPRGVMPPPPGAPPCMPDASPLRSSCVRSAGRP